ncbi:WhiB family transcriptional regulator [Streptomyces flaveolus]|uniref:WhiB family transcriptional regulator n=1 Tax=Streptomyces flaveolus TaxID=67297 RepID=UPI003824E030
MNRHHLVRISHLPATDLPVNPNWRARAACRTEDPDLFFPVGNTGPALYQIEEAKAVCRRCPVMERCLQWALDSGQEHGVWGGLSEDDRRRLKRRAARKHTTA